MGVLRPFSHHTSELMPRRICLPRPPTCLNRLFQQPDHLTFSVTPSLKRSNSSTGILTRSSIAYAFLPRLRYRLTLSGLTLLRNPWAYGDKVSHLVYRLLIPAASLVCPPVVLTLYLHQYTQRSPTTHNLLLNYASTASVTCLSPVTFSAHEDSTSELLRFL